MDHKKVILLDEYDFYKAENDSVSRTFLQEHALSPVLIDSKNGLQICKNRNYPSGTIMVQSPNNKNNYFSILNAVQDFKAEYFEILMDYAPLLGASEIIIRCEIDEKQVNKNRIKHQGSLSIPVGEVNTQYHHDSLSEKMRSLKLTQEHKSTPILKDKKTVIEKLESSGINYEDIPMLKRMIHLDNNSYMRDSISIVDVMKESKSTLRKLSADGGIKKIPILKKVAAEYEGESESELILINETKIEIEIKFHELNEKVVNENL
jgi:hypothetical protein